MKLPAAAQFDDFFTNEIWREAVRIICQRHRLKFTNLIRAENGENIVFLVDENYVVKIYVPTKNGMMERERNALEIARTHLKIPQVLGSGEIENYEYLITNQLAGESLTREMWLKMPSNEQITVLSQLAKGLRELNFSDASSVDFNWQSFVQRQAETCFERQKLRRVNRQILDRIPSYLEENLHLLPKNCPPLFMHGDVHFGNLRFSRNSGKPEISGLFDFADSLKGFHEYEFLAVTLLMIQGQADLQREFFRFSGYADADINEDLRKRLMLLTMFYEWSDLRRYAIRLRPEAVDYSLDQLEKEIWNFV